MQLNDLLEPLKQKWRFILIAGVLLILISSIIGVSIGIAKKGAVTNVEPKLEVSERGKIGEEEEPRLILPSPITPELVIPRADYLSYFDFHSELFEEMAPVQIKNSDLIRTKRLGLTSDVKPFYFMGEELDVLIYEDEISEP
ncbi:MAG: hypothetical protein ACUVWJ_11835 [Spirochaetota bacterium]